MKIFSQYRKRRESCVVPRVLEVKKEIPVQRAQFSGFLVPWKEQPGRDHRTGAGGEQRSVTEITDQVLREVYTPRVLGCKMEIPVKDSRVAAGGCVKPPVVTRRLCFGGGRHAKQEPTNGGANRMRGTFAIDLLPYYVLRPIVPRRCIAAYLAECRKRP